MKNAYKIVLHSAVDVITNSSTVIYTYSDGSLSAVKELVNEMLRVFESPKTFDDLFCAGVFLDDDYNYYESDDFPKLDGFSEDFEYGGSEYVEYENKTKKYLEDLFDQIMSGEIEKPAWMLDIEENDNGDYKRSTCLFLKVKDEKYSELSKKLLGYLTSADHEASYG